MKCPSCNTENNEGAKFCKKCGTALKNNKINHEEMIKSMSNDKSDNTTKIIIVALIIVAIVLAGVFIYLQGFGHHDSQAQNASASKGNSSVSQSDSASNPVKSATPTSSEPEKTAKSTNPIKIQGGSFSTGSADADKTYASIYLGKQHAGEKVIVQIWYSRDGNTLNHGNMVPVTVHSDGYVELSSADAYKYYPDYATINVYDSNSNLLDTQSVSLSPTSGTQTF
ncbi:zinc ribbon domain-containing protein [Methanobrevibacter sp.]|uniref:zinc ribbon domain-containing protein n=1 Tax=Methanobrevibacter sp. TaxID=66852 RepID=UPI00388EE7CF